VCNASPFFGGMGLNDDIAFKILSVLERIDARLQTIENSIENFSGDLCGFSTGNSHFPGRLDDLAGAIREEIRKTAK